MARLLFFTLFLGISFSAIAQFDINKPQDVIRNTTDILHELRRDELLQEQMKKSKMDYYMDQEWQAGVVFVNDSLTLNGLLYRYNIYTNQIEIRSVLNPSGFQIVSIGSTKFIYSGYYNDLGNVENSYFELKANGNCKLLLKRDINYKKGKSEVEAYGTNSATSVKKNYYIKIGNKPAILIEKSKESLKDVLKDKTEAVSYINKQKLLFISEKKIIEIVKFYNSI